MPRLKFSTTSPAPAAEPWIDALENYNFDEQDGHTTVTGEVDTHADYVASFNKQFPLALKKLNELCTTQ